MVTQVEPEKPKESKKHSNRYVSILLSQTPGKTTRQTIGWATPGKFFIEKHLVQQYVVASSIVVSRNIAPITFIRFLSGTYAKLVQEEDNAALVPLPEEDDDELNDLSVFGDKEQVCLLFTFILYGYYVHVL